MPKTIFVSHAAADTDTTRRIHDALERSTGCELWVDVIDLKPPLPDFRAGLHEALKTADACLLILSAVALTRPEVTAEWNYALAVDPPIPLFIARIEDIPLRDINPRLLLVQWVDLTRDWDGGLAALAAFIRGETPAPDAPVALLRPVTGKLDRRLTGAPLRGREAELRALLRDLRKPRPVGLIGVGGLGKSRLAAEAVLEADNVGGAIWHVASDVSRADEVIELARAHFGLDGTAPEAEVLKRLKANKRLTVIDNAESVHADDPRRADYGRVIEALLEAGTPVLLTSRAEWTELEPCAWIKLPPLPAEDARQIVLDMAATYAVERDLSAEAADLAEAARRHPRLIEWAVRLLKRYPLKKVLDDLRGLKGATIQEALDEMILKTLREMSAVHGDGPAAALRRLAVCRDGFSYAAAQAISGLSDDGLLDSALDTLQTWQFVRLDGDRYAIDPLVIEAVGEDDSAHRPHYDFYKALALEHHEKQDYLGLDPESANLEAAFEWAMRTGQFADAYWLGGNAASNFLANQGRFAQRLDWLERVAARILPPPAVTQAPVDPYVIAAVQNSLGILYQNHPLGDRRANLRRAIAAYEAALSFYTPEAAPLDYAASQNNLGTAYQTLATVEDRVNNLRKAIAAYTAALVYYTPAAAPLAYAATQNNLGAAYRNLADVEDRAANLRRAITAYENALVYRTPEAAPLSYATTQNNLGIAYRKLSDIEDRATNLRRAITAYEAALAYSTPEVAPLSYAMTQNNLGAAYRSISETEDRTANLGRAIAAYEAALVYLTPEAAPLDYAATQNNLGTAYGDLAAVEDRTANLLQAITAYTAALVYYTPEAAPLNYAATQNNLGATYHKLSEVEDGTANLRRAISAFEAALVYRTPEAAPLDYAMTQGNLGIALEDSDDLAGALACWRRAEAVFQGMGMVEYADRVAGWIKRAGG